MNFTSVAVAGIVRQRRNRGGLEDLISSSQLGHLTLEPLDLGVLLAAHPDPLAGRHPPRPGAPSCAASQLSRHPTWRLRPRSRPAASHSSLVPQRPSDRTLPQLRWIFRSSMPKTPSLSQLIEPPDTPGDSESGYPVASAVLPWTEGALPTRRIPAQMVPTTFGPSPGPSRSRGRAEACQRHLRWIVSLGTTRRGRLPRPTLRAAHDLVQSRGILQSK